MYKLIKTIAPLVNWFIAVNLVSFILISIYLGGDAVNGKIIADHYFLGNGHNYTEVDKSMYVYSQYHAVFILLTFLFAMLVKFIGYKLNLTEISCKYSA